MIPCSFSKICPAYWTSICDSEDYQARCSIYKDLTHNERLRLDLEMRARAKSLRFFNAPKVTPSSNAEKGFDSRNNLSSLPSLTPLEIKDYDLNDIGIPLRLQGDKSRDGCWGKEK